MPRCDPSGDHHQQCRAHADALPSPMVSHDVGGIGYGRGRYNGISIVAPFAPIRTYPGETALAEMPFSHALGNRQAIDAPGRHPRQCNAPRPPCGYSSVR